MPGVLHFYPRPPYGGRQTGNVTGIHTHWISIHVPRMGDDIISHILNIPMTLISIHVPRMGDDIISHILNIPMTLISIHVPRMGDDPIHHHQIENEIHISIHVPRMGDDNFPDFARFAYANFYPRPPYGGQLQMQRIMPEIRR